MKPRDRQANAQAALATVPQKEPVNGSVAHAALNPGPAGSFVWEDWYRSASPDQQAELLALARRQGLLYVQQIPPHNNGCHQTNGVDESGGLQTLKDILTGHIGKLAALPDAMPPVACAPGCWDAELDPLQRQAVMRALATPDICLIQGPPGTGKSRVVTEILTQSAQRGLRTLFLAQNAACVDGVLEQLGCRPGLAPIRLTCPGETVSAAVQPMLLAERMGSFPAQIVAQASESRDHAVETCKERQCQAEMWALFAGWVDEHRNLEDSLHGVREQLARVAAEVEAEAAELLGESYRTLLAKKDQDLAQVRASIEEVEQKIKALEQESARPSGGLLGWLKGLFGGKPAAGDASSDAYGQLQGRRKELDEQERQIEQHFKVERDRLLQEVLARRQKSLAEQETGLAGQIRKLEEQWQSLASRLHPETLRPQAMTGDAVDEAQQLWQTQKQLDEDNCSLAQHWVAFLQESGERLAARLPGLAGIVAGTLAGWNHEGGSIPGTFDLLILEEADQVTEAVLLQLALRARRWVLVGNYLGQPMAAASAPANPREVRPPTRTSVFQRLWPLLHADPSQLPYVWGLENDRPFCQFRPLSCQDLSRLERENLADAPDIELRILTVPRCEPVLAQVVFPPGTTLPRAKDFIFRELQEIPLQTTGRNGWLEEHGESFIWRLVPQPPQDVQSVPLEPGLMEWMDRDQTTHLEFARSQWNRQRVLDWIAKRFRHRDLGRTVFLQIPHRMETSLAAWIGDVFFPGTLLARRLTDAPADLPGSAPQALADGQPVSFVPVTPPPPSRARDQNGHARTPARDLALEIDLAAGRGAERVPVDLLAGLARHGYANYLEAQAVVRTLESLVGQVANLPLENGRSASCPTGVMAFYAGQVELIRRLLARSTILAGRAIQVGLPSQFLHGQCKVAVLSLTRSNGLRSGVFSPDVADPILAMTRACEKLILVGDPDTLLRWSTGQESGESHDPGREKHWLRRLARYLRREGSHQDAFLLCANA